MDYILGLAGVLTAALAGNTALNAAKRRKERAAREKNAAIIASMQQFAGIYPGMSRRARREAGRRYAKSLAVATRSSQASRTEQRRKQKLVAKLVSRTITNR